MPRGNHSSNGRNGHDRPSVLVVNDIADQLELMNSALCKAGYSVFTAEDGREAFDVAKRERPDLIVSDVTMPNVDGIQLCRLIRQDAELSAKPILLVTTPIGLIEGFYECYKLAGGLVFLMVAMVGALGVAMATVIATIRREGSAGAKENRWPS